MPAAKRGLNGPERCTSRTSDDHCGGPRRIRFGVNDLLSLRQVPAPTLTVESVLRV
jgi:hypothetical protein